MNIEKEGLFTKISVALSIMLYQLIEEKNHVVWQFNPCGVNKIVKFYFPYK